MFSDHNRTKLGINDNDSPGNRERNFKEEMMRAIKKHAKLNDNENNTN